MQTALLVAKILSAVALLALAAALVNLWRRPEVPVFSYGSVTLAQRRLKAVWLAFLVGALAVGSNNDPVMQSTEDRVDPASSLTESGRLVTQSLTLPLPFYRFERTRRTANGTVVEEHVIAEGWPFHEGRMSHADMIHYQVAAKKLAFEDRIRYLDDPRFGDPKIAMLISKEFAAKRRRLADEILERRPAAVANQSSDTTYLCAADRDGNAISFIQSVFAPFGSRVIGGDTGVIMNNRLCSFGLDVSRANSLKPGKRPAHTLNTYMVFQGDEVFAAGGSPGADEQPQTNFQIIHDLVDLEMDPQSAVEAPRWSHQPGTPPRDQLPESLRMEEGYDPATLDVLRTKGHQISVVDRWSFGSAKVIVRDRENGCWLAGADPRRVAYALGY